ncbi:MAG TPA: hypothetical protein VLA72_01905 [Anaerolineales bacterium]|nr:hypothetical protein [Anaerolineales bacterium]
MSNKTISIYSEALKRHSIEEKKNLTRESTPKNTRTREPSSDTPREDSRRRPTRDEVQEFSFRLRDDLKVKVQAEVPHGWQKELEEIARQMDVKKLELYRFIIGKFVSSQKIGEALKRIPPHTQKMRQNEALPPYLVYRLSIQKTVTPNY